MMKRTILKSMMVAMGVLLSLYAKAYDAYVNGVYYNLNTWNQTATVTYGNNKYTGEVSIPGTIYVQNSSYTVTYTVTSIASLAFSNCDGLNSVSIPSTITSIGDCAFQECASLTSITIPASVTSIGRSPFYMCSKLKSIIVDEHNPIYDSRNSCNAIIETASNTLIQGCNSTIIPEEITSIGDGAFTGCKRTTPMTIPDNVSYIGASAFSNCGQLSTIDNLRNLEFIGAYAFNGTDWLANQPNGLVYIGDFLYTYKGTMPNNTGITINSGTTSIVGGSFSHRTNLTSIIIPNSVVYIGDNAFYSCSGLKSVTIPNSVTNIGRYAFSGCTNLTSLDLGNSVKSVESAAFISCSGLTSVTIPNSVTNIGGSAFSSCSNLTSVISEMETPVAYKGSLFSGISSTCTLTVPYGTKDAYIAAGWTEEVFKGGVVEASAPVQNITFADANVKALCVDNWDTNEDGELSEAEAAAVTSLGEVFKGNTDITSFDELQYFTGLTTIEHHAFYNCSNLTSVTIPNSVTYIQYYAFERCSSLTSVTIPNSVNFISVSPFRSCSGLTSISVENGNAKYDSRNNCNAIIETATNTLISGCKNTAIPNSVTSIGNYAFDSCSGLTSITIPNSVTSIGNYAFDSCSGLTSITIPNSVTTIGNNAFYGCSGLTSVTIPNSVTTIDDNAFYGCSGLTSVISEIEEPYAFCNSAFNRISSTCTLTVPAGTRDAYIAAGWTTDVFKGGIIDMSEPENIFVGNGCFFKALTIEGVEMTFKILSVTQNTVEVYSIDRSTTGVLTIPKNVNYGGKEYTVTSIRSAFNGCSNLTSVTIPNSVNFISVSPFRSCSGLTSISVENGNAKYDSRNNCNAIIETATNTLISGCKNTVIPNSVTSIGEAAFYGCSDLTSVIIPNSVTSIERIAFYGCTCLTSVISEIENPFGFGDYVFLGIASTCTLTVPAGTRDAYIAKGWTESIFKGGVVEAESAPTIAGDANGDNEVDIFDVTAIVNSILGSTSANFVEAAADVNGDGEVDIFDVTAIVNMILGVDTSAGAKVRGAMSMLTGTIVATTDGDGMNLKVEDADQYTAMQFDVVTPEGLTLEDVMLNSDTKHTLAYAQTGENRYTVVIYSMRNRGFNPTEDALVCLLLSDGSVVEVEDVRCVRTDGRRVQMRMLMESATGIAGMNAESDSDAIYNLSGQFMGTHAESLPAGIYIRNNKKFIIK